MKNLLIASLLACLCGVGTGVHAAGLGDALLGQVGGDLGASKLGASWAAAPNPRRSRLLAWSARPARATRPA